MKVVRHVQSTQNFNFTFHKPSSAWNPVIKSMWDNPSHNVNESKYQLLLEYQGDQGTVNKIFKNEFDKNTP